MAEQRRAKKRAQGLVPFPRQPIYRRGDGAEVNHGVRPTRFAMPLPDSVKGPVRAREVRERDKGVPGRLQVRSRPTRNVKTSD